MSAVTPRDVRPNASGHINDRRKRFYGRHEAMTQEQREARKMEKKANMKRVRKALEAAAVEIPIKPLRRFGCKLMVSLHYHTTTKGGQPKVTRCNAVMLDSTPLAKFGAWAALQLDIKPEKAAGLTFQYFNAGGRGVRVDKQHMLQQWLDHSWAHHPPQMHVYSLDALVEEAESRAELLGSMFHEYDLDHSGTISLYEMREMLMRLGLARELSISSEDYAHFVADEVDAADVDNDGVITREEFDAYYNQLQDSLKDALSSSNHFDHTRSRWLRAHTEARSYRRALGDWVDNFGGVVTLDSLGHDYQITAEFSPSCVSDANRGWWVRAQTVLESNVDHFEDAADVLGEPFSPVVWVSFEADMELGDNYVVTMPHSFEYCDASKLFDKTDVVVVFGTFEDHFWHEVDPDCWEMLFPDEAAGRPYPSLRVTVPDEGVLCAFARTGRKVEQRVQCLAYLPEKMIPLEEGVMRVHVVPHLPEQIEISRHDERLRRGNVVLGGKSEVQSVLRGTALDVALTMDETETHAVIWSCEAQVIEYDIDPRELRGIMAGEHGKAIEGLDNDGQGEEREGHIQLKATARNLQGARGGARGGGRSGGAGLAFTVDIVVHLHAFPNPSAPRNVRCVSRTQHVLQIVWDMPLQWGGCALASYEVQVREISQTKGEGKWEVKYTAEGDKTRCALHLSVWKCEVRVRCSNIASELPSEFSESLLVGSPKEEDASAIIQAAVRGNASRNRGTLAKSKSLDEGLVQAAPPSAPVKPSVARHRSMSGASSVSMEGGLVTVEQQDLQVKNVKDCKPQDAKAALKKRKAATDMSDDAVWNPFTRTIGELFVEMGVPGGVEGTMFDLTPHGVQELVEHGSQGWGALSLQKPVMSLAAVATWVLATLGHHAEDYGEWIEEMQAIEGLVLLAARHNVGGDTGSFSPTIAASLRRFVRGIIAVLFEVYETLRQCEPETGYITCQLAHKYEKPLKKRLKEEWGDQMERMREDIASHVANMVLEMNSTAPPVALDRHVRGVEQNTALVMTGMTGQARERVVYVTAIEAQGVARTKKPLRVSFTLEGGPACSTLRTSPAVNPRWDDGIVTLPVPDGAPDKPLHLRMELWDVTPEEQAIGVATPIGVAEASLEHEAGRLYNHDLQGGPGGDTISFSFRIGSTLAKSPRNGTIAERASHALNTAEDKVEHAIHAVSHGVGSMAKGVSHALDSAADRLSDMFGMHHHEAATVVQKHVRGRQGRKAHEARKAHTG